MPTMTKTEKLNLAATIVGPIAIVGMIGWATWSFNTKMSNLFLEEDKHNTETYVPKAWFEKSHEETNKKLDTLSDNVNKVNEDVATIKGELSHGKPN
jgi:hypothetical protein